MVEHLRPLQRVRCPAGPRRDRHGVALFIASCVLIALSDTGGGVIAGRVIQRLGIGPVIAAGFAAATAGCWLLSFVQGDWRYGAFVLPLVLLAAGPGLVNGPASSASTSPVSADDVGAASSISNMAR